MNLRPFRTLLMTLLLLVVPALAQESGDVDISVPLPPGIAVTTIPTTQTADSGDDVEEVPVVAMPTPTATTNAAVTAPSESFAAQYGILSERSIFLRNRPRPRPVSSIPQATTRPPAAPEQDYVLRGIVLEDADLRAYVENAPASRMLRLLPGDTVARGQITQIEADAVLFQHDGEQMWIEIGHDFAGTRAVAPAAVAQPTTMSAGRNMAAPAGVAQPPGALSGVEERMRLRRLQSGGGRPTR